MRPAWLLLPLAFAACGRVEEQPQDLDGLDRDLTAATGPAAPDPAVTAALHDQIMVDPFLQQQSNANAVKPPPRPDPGSTPVGPPPADPVDATSVRPVSVTPGDCPACQAKAGALTLAALAARQPAPAIARCADVRYSAGWATRLPADLPLYPGAQVREAAGNDASGCALRLVSFATAAPPAKLIGWYHARAKAAGYSAEHRAQGQLHALGGPRGEAAYMIYASPSPDGTIVDLIAAGR